MRKKILSCFCMIKAFRAKTSDSHYWIHEEAKGWLSQETSLSLCNLITKAGTEPLLSTLVCLAK